MNRSMLIETAAQMVADGKGLLAADESFGTIKKRLEAVGVESTEESRKAYRDLLFTAPQIEEFISGVILFDETIRQKSVEGTPFPELLKRRGILPGIKVDRGAKEFALHAGEKVTEGLDGLADRFSEYFQLGARFSKWRAVITIGDAIPSDQCIVSNAEALARYAALAQEADIVPIVEPEVLIDGGHSLDQCEEVTCRTLDAVFGALKSHSVMLEGIILKPSMVIAGLKAKQPSSIEQVAQATVRTLKRSVPAAVPGIAFLSGGQTPEQATAHLDAINRMGPHPWQITFSYARALQNPAMDAWRGHSEAVAKAAQAFSFRAKMNHLARLGEYNKELEGDANRLL